MIQWTNLTTCYGQCVQNPSEDQLKSALSELFCTNDDEHPDSWIECGSEGGPLYSLSIFSSGYAIYTKFSDVDMSHELESRKISDISEEKAFQLWKDLINGRTTKI